MGLYKIGDKVLVKKLVLPQPRKLLWQWSLDYHNSSYDWSDHKSSQKKILNNEYQEGHT